MNSTLFDAIIVFWCAAVSVNPSMLKGSATIAWSGGSATVTPVGTGALRNVTPEGLRMPSDCAGPGVKPSMIQTRSESAGGVPMSTSCPAVVISADGLSTAVARPNGDAGVPKTAAQTSPLFGDVDTTG